MIDDQETRKNLIVGILTLVVVIGLIIVGSIYSAENETTIQSDNEGSAEEKTTNENLPTSPSRRAAENGLEIDDQLVDVAEPSSAALSVEWQRRSTEPFDMTEPISQHYLILRTNAEAGSKFAAVNLYELVKTCQSAYTEESQLNAAIDRLYQTHMLQTPDMPEPVRIAEPEIVEEYINIGLREPFVNCKGLTDEQKQSPKQWLELAAELGDNLAQIEVSRFIDDNEIALEYLERSWQQGDSGALEFMAERYWRNYESGENPGDKIRSHAAFIAYAHLMTAGMQGHGQIADRWVLSVQKRLATMASTMRPNEISDALALSQQLIQENGNCCYEL